MTDSLPFYSILFTQTEQTSERTVYKQCIFDLFSYICHLFKQVEIAKNV